MALPEIELGIDLLIKTHRIEFSSLNHKSNYISDNAAVLHQLGKQILSLKNDPNDEYEVDNLINKCPNTKNGDWGNGKTNASYIWLTHDIDQIKISYQVLSWFKEISLNYGLISGLKFLFDSLYYRGTDNDLINNIDFILNCEADYNIKSTFFLLNQRRINHLWNLENIPFNFGTYSFRDKGLHKIANNILLSGSEIGIHGSFGSAISNLEHFEDVKALSSSFGREIRFNRQHYLDFHPWKTTDILEDAGIRLDSSVGFNPPFFGNKFKTRYPIYLPKTNFLLSKVLHITPYFMEGMLVRDSYKKQIDDLLIRMKRDMTTHSVIWHNSKLNKYFFYRDAFKYFLDKAVSMDFCFLTAEEVLNKYNIKQNGI